MLNIATECMHYSMHSHTGNGFQLVEATGIIVVGHFSIDGELKKEHYSTKNHNMLVVKGKMKLMEEIIGVLTFPGQCVLHLITNLEDGQGYLWHTLMFNDENVCT